MTQCGPGCVIGLSCISDSTPILGISICCRIGQEEHKKVCIFGNAVVREFAPISSARFFFFLIINYVEFYVILYISKDKLFFKLCC